MSQNVNVFRTLKFYRSGAASCGRMLAGDSTTAIPYTAGTPPIALYFTTSNATSTNAEPFYLKSIVTGAGGYGGRSRFHTYSNVASGTNVMALKAHTEFGSSGSVTGLATALCAELVMPNAAVGGSYFSLEIEYVAGGTSTQATNRGWVYMNNTGDAAGDFDTNGVFMRVDGLTAGAANLLSANSQTLKCHIGSSSTVRYLVMSQSADIFHSNVSALGADARAHRMIATCATPAMTDGYGAFEQELTVSGTATGGINAASCWINLGTSAVVPGYMTLRNDGIWDGTATLTNAYISMHKFQCLLASNPALLSIWELNFQQDANNEIDCLFNVNDASRALGYQAGTPTKAAVGSIPFFKQAGGATFYIYVYDEADAD